MIEISFSYKPLYKVSILHNYYAEQPAGDFRLVPTDDSKKLAKKLGLVFKETNSECFLLYEPDKLEGLFGEMERTYPVKFTYLLFASSPYFVNYTQVPVDIHKGMYYFSNNQVTRHEESIMMHSSEYASDNNRHPVKKELQISADGVEKHIELRDDNGSIILIRKISGQEKVVIDNSLVAPGLYHYYLNGSKVETFILFTNIPVIRPVGMIEVSLSGLIKDEVIHGIEDYDVPFFNYQISFSARNTFWKYLLIGKYKSNLKNTIIDSGVNDLKFNGPDEVKMKNGQDAIVFVSDRPLPLKQMQDFRFQLKSIRTGITAGKTIMDRLPFPSVEMIKPETKEENSKVFSEIIVYI